jgi:hypothetical protein
MTGKIHEFLAALRITSRMTKRASFIAALSILAAVTACTYFGPFVRWQEEVKLSDGRIIVVEQKKRADGGMAREAWLTIPLPEVSPQPIVWYEHLSPLIVNLDNGKLYVVGYTPTEVEFDLFGHPNPFYIAFVWERGNWTRIPFGKIPKQIYDTNMLIEGFPPTGTKYLDLATKNGPALNGNGINLPQLKRLDPRATYE